MNSNLEKFADELGFNKPGNLKDGKYIIQLDNSDEYARYYTKLDHCEDLELVETSSMSSEYSSVLTYANDSYKVSLNANFSDDYYTIIIEEIHE